MVPQFPNTLTPRRRVRYETSADHRPGLEFRTSLPVPRGARRCAGILPASTRVIDCFARDSHGHSQQADARDDTLALPRSL